MVVFGQILLNSCNVVVVRKSGCFWARGVVFGKEWLYSGKSGWIRAKVVVIGQSSCIWAKVVVIKQKLL